MTRKEWYERNDVNTALNLGIVSGPMFSRYVYFKLYEQYRERGIEHSDAIQFVADDRKTSFSNVWRAVSFFRKSTTGEYL